MSARFCRARKSGQKVAKNGGSKFRLVLASFGKLRVLYPLTQDLIFKSRRGLTDFKSLVSTIPPPGLGFFPARVSSSTATG